MLYVIYFVESLLFASAGLFAFWKGDRGLRVAGAWVLLLQIVGTVIDLVSRHHVSTTFWLGFDSLTAMGFMGLAIYTASLWSGICLLVSAGTAALQAVYIINECEPDVAYHTASNIMTLVLNASLVAGTVLAIRRRMKSTSQRAPAAALEPLAA